MFWILVTYLAYVSAITTFPLFLTIFLTVIVLKILVERVKRDKPNASGTISVGFFHPYCNAGGGGEKVLWCAVSAIHKRYPAATCIIYTGDTDAAPDQILAKAEQRWDMFAFYCFMNRSLNLVRLRFDMTIPGDRLEWVYLHKRRWVEAATWPRFTMMGQSVGSLILGRCV